MVRQERGDFLKKVGSRELLCFDARCHTSRYSSTQPAAACTVCSAVFVQAAPICAVKHGASVAVLPSSLPLSLCLAFSVPLRALFHALSAFGGPRCLGLRWDASPSAWIRCRWWETGWRRRCERVSSCSWFSVKMLVFRYKVGVVVLYDHLCVTGTLSPCDTFHSNLPTMTQQSAFILPETLPARVYSEIPWASHQPTSTPPLPNRLVLFGL